MTRGRKPKPTYLKIIEGNPGRRPINPNEPKPDRSKPVEPPECLSTRAREEWDRKAPELMRMGLLTSVDAVAFGAYCQAVGRTEFAEKALAEMAAEDPKQRGALMVQTALGNPIMNPYLAAANRAWADAVKYAAEFGMTPASRVRLANSGAAPASPGEVDPLRLLLGKPTG
jgi:P27 family predicted phage terminase small subunit